MVPKTINNDILKLVDLVNKKSKPFFIPVIPESYSIPGACFPTVEEKIKRHGGKMVLGWQLWETNLLAEAEFHAIWESPDGVLLDVTPKDIPIEKILFLSDSKTKYSGKQVDNIRMNMTNNPLVDDFIELAKLKFRLLNRGDLVNKIGEVRLTGKDAQIFQAILEIKDGVYAMILKNCTRNNLCFCGRNIKYKHCHGKDLKKAIKCL